MPAQAHAVYEVVYGDDELYYVPTILSIIIVLNIEIENNHIQNGVQQ